MTDADTTTHRTGGGHATAPSGPTAATPAWMNTATRPLEAVLSGSGHSPVSHMATLWPLGHESDTATRAGRYLPETSRHPQRTRAVLAAHIINRYSHPGQLVFDGFAGSGTTLVEAVYAGRPAVGVEVDPRWVDLTVANLAFAAGNGATGHVQVGWRDTRHLAPTPRRLRHRVDLVVANPPLQFKPATPDKSDDATMMTTLERDVRAAISSWMPMLHPGSTRVFINRLQPADGYLLDPAVPIAAAAHRCGLVPVDRAAALRVPIRDAMSTTGRRGTTRKSRGPVVVQDDILVYRVPAARPVGGEANDRSGTQPPQHIGPPAPAIGARCHSAADRRTVASGAQRQRQPRDRRTAGRCDNGRVPPRTAHPGPASTGDGDRYAYHADDTDIESLLDAWRTTTRPGCHVDILRHDGATP